jgi:putative oxidoreductase
MTPVRTAARAMLGTIFVVSGARGLADPDSLVPKAKRVTERVGPLLDQTDERLSPQTQHFVQANSAVQVAGGLLLVTRARRPAAAILAGSLIPTTVAGHPFWEEDDPAARSAERLQFMKNMGLFGGLVLAALDTEGRPNLRRRTSRAVSDAINEARRLARSTSAKSRIAVRAANVGRRLPG